MPDTRDTSQVKLILYPRCAVTLLIRGGTVCAKTGVAKPPLRPLRVFQSTPSPYCPFHAISVFPQCTLRSRRMRAPSINAVFVCNRQRIEQRRPQSLVRIEGPAMRTWLNRQLILNTWRHGVCQDRGCEAPPPPSPFSALSVYSNPRRIRVVIQSTSSRFCQIQVVSVLSSSSCRVRVIQSRPCPCCPIQAVSVFLQSAPHPCPFNPRQVRAAQSRLCPCSRNPR